MHNLSFVKNGLFLLLLQFVIIKAAISQDSILNVQRPVFAEMLLLYDFPQSYGFTAGVNLPFASVIKNKSYKDYEVRKQRDFFFSAIIGFYRYPFNYTGLFMIPSIGIRSISKNTYHEFAVGIGLLRTFYDGKVYKVDASSNVKELPVFGRYYATANFSYAFGRQLKKKRPNLDLQVKPQLWFQFPYNSFIKPHLSLAVGVRYHFSNVNMITRTRTKHKKL